MAEIEVGWRFRVNVKQLADGRETFDCTAEGSGVTQEEVIAESDKLVAALRAKYPPKG